MDSATDDDCPICMGPLQNPSQPVPCCNKVFCLSCLSQAILTRPQCPHCRSSINNTGTLTYTTDIQYGVQDSSASLRTIRTVILDMQSHLQQHRAAIERAQRASQRASQRSVSLLSQVSSSAPQPVVIPRLRHLPRRRSQADSGRLNLLGAAIAPASQISFTPNVSLPSQVASNAAQPVVIPQLSPVPRIPRANIQVAPFIPFNTSPNPVSILANSSLQLNHQSDDSDVDWLDEIDAMEYEPRSRNIDRTYNCPYCQEGGLDDRSLRDHCNINHINDVRQVVCPVCVSLPHGNPSYCSRNFIGHLNLRHRYNIEDVTNINRTDDINMQDAILNSLQQS